MPLQPLHLPRTPLGRPPGCFFGFIDVFFAVFFDFMLRVPF